MREIILFYILISTFVGIIAIVIAIAIGASRKPSVPGSHHNPPSSYSAPPNAPAEAESEYKNCPMCGEEIKSVAIKCKHCNSILQGKGDKKAMTNAGNDTLGTVSLVTGIVGFFIGILLVHFGVLLGLTAVVCGVLGYGKGQKYSLIGIVIGIAAVLFSLIYAYMSAARFSPLIF